MQKGDPCSLKKTKSKKKIKKIKRKIQECKSDIQRVKYDNIEMEENLLQYK